MQNHWVSSITSASNAELEPIFIQNLMFLEDYLRFTASVPEEKMAQVEERVKASPGITLASCLASESKVRANDVYVMIAQDRLYVDLAAVPLREHSWVQLYPDKQTHDAHVLYGPAKFPSSITSTTKLVANTPLVWDGRLWRKREHGRNYYHTAAGNGTTHAIAFWVLSPVVGARLYQHP